MQGHAMPAPAPGARRTPCAPGRSAPARGPALAALPAPPQPRPPAWGGHPRSGGLGDSPARPGPPVQGWSGAPVREEGKAGGVQKRGWGWRN